MSDHIRPFGPDIDLLDAVGASKRPVVRIYPFGGRAVVAGRGSRLESEIRMSRLRSDKIPIFRRKGGGCSVFLDPGNLIVAMAFPAPGLGRIRALFDQSSQGLIRGFRNMGLAGIYQDGISDLVMEDRKIGGSCFYRSLGLAYYSAAILVTPDLDAMERYLTHPPREPDYRRGRSHREFVSGLDVFTPGMTVDRLARELKPGLTAESLDRAA